MDFDLTEEHKMIRDMCRDFTQEVISPRAEELERTGEYAYDIIDQMAELILRTLGLNVTEAARIAYQPLSPLPQPDQRET